jgi:hypothetical protein
MYKRISQQTSADRQLAQNRGGLWRGHDRNCVGPHAVDTKSDDGNKDASESSKEVARWNNGAHRAQIGGDTFCDLTQSCW